MDEREHSVTAAERFDEMWYQRLLLDRPPAVLIADALADAAAAVLDADGAGITVTAGSAGTAIRSPIGASNPMASTAERLQYTVGSGPCFQVFDEQQANTFPQGALERDHLPFTTLMLSDTPFRSVAAAPLGFGGPWGMLNVYYDQDTPRTDARTVGDIGVRVTAVLGATSALEEALTGTSSEPAPWDDRARVWQATGMTGGALRLTMSDALALLRSAAFAENVDVDQFAADVVSGVRDPLQF